MPKAGFYDPVAKSGWRPALPLAGARDPVIPILFYRSMLLASDVAPIDALSEALRAKGMRPVPIFVASLKDVVSARFVEQALRESEARPHRHRDGFRRGRGARRGNAVRPRRRAGHAGDRRHHAARSLGEEPARAGTCRPRHACRDARVRWPHPGRRALLQGRERSRPRTRLPRLRQQAGARPRRAGRRAHRGDGPSADDAARKTPRRDPDAGLSRCRRPHRLRRRPRCTLLRARHAA